MTSLVLKRSSGYAHAKDLDKPGVRLHFDGSARGYCFLYAYLAATSELKQLGNGPLRYVIAVPSAISLGALIILSDWKLGKALWRKCQPSSKQVQNRLAISLFALQLVWIALAAVLGTKLAAFVAEHISP